MNFEYIVKIENMSEEGVKAFLGIANNHEHLREALSSNPEETFGMMREEIWETECHVESRSGMILGFIKSAYPDSIPELFTKLHQNLIDAGGTETRAVIHILQEDYHYYASYFLENSDDGLSTIKHTHILDHQQVHYEIIDESWRSKPKPLKSITDIRAEVFEDLNVEVIDGIWEWDDLLYPNASRIMESDIYCDFFHDNACSVLQSLQKECEEMWEFKSIKI